MPAGRIGGRIYHRCNRGRGSVHNKHSAEAGWPTDCVVIQAQADRIAVASAVRHLGEDRDGENIARIELIVGDGTECNRHLLGVARVTGHSLDVFGFAGSDRDSVLSNLRL